MIFQCRESSCLDQSISLCCLGSAEQLDDEEDYDEVSEVDEEELSGVDEDKPAVDSDLGGADLASPYESPGELLFYLRRR